MRRLLRLLIDKKDYFVFFIALLISFFLLFSNDSPQIQILRSKAGGIISTLYTPVRWVEGINQLKEENEELTKSISQLKLLNSTLLSNLYENQQLREMLEYERNSYLELLPSHIIGKSISPLLTSITTDVGSLDGIKKDMAVISADGVIGKSVAVGEKTSIVQIMPDYNFRMSVKLESRNVTGILRWKSGSQFEIWEIPKPTEVNIGERVLTSGYSDIFPENLPVGIVTEVINRREELNKIIIGEGFVDYASLQHVFFVMKDNP
tara:strand:+ start:3650 stop:4441 length:792 start_codon:yes stop_codon:yes gene_type:complete